MAKQKKHIRIWSESGDQHGSVYNDLYTDDCGNSIYKYLHETERNPMPVVQGFVCGVQPTNPKSVFNKLLIYIVNDDSVKFEALLRIDFIYPGRISSYSTNNDHSRGEWSEYAEATYYVRPNVEALFIEDNDLFIQLINLLIEKNDERFYTAFRNSLANTILANASLFEWNANIQQKISSQITDLQRYGTTLLDEKDAGANAKGDQIKTLTQALDARVKGRNAAESKVTSKEEFENLQFKLQLTRDLHQQDQDFRLHRGWKRAAANAVPIALLAGIPNFVKWCVTGNGFFCNKTTTQEKISNTHAAIGFDPKEAIRFKK